MKKKISIFVLWIVTIVLAFYGGLKIENVSNENKVLNKTNDTITKTETVQKSEGIVEIPLSDIETIVAQKQNVLTQQEAEKLCRDALGDKAEENGFPISYRCISAVSANDKLYYVMHITWLVDNNNWSYIGNCYVSIDGQEIYDGIVSSGKYEMTELRWKK